MTSHRKARRAWWRRYVYMRRCIKIGGGRTWTNAAYLAAVREGIAAEHAWLRRMGKDR